MQEIFELQLINKRVHKILEYLIYSCQIDSEAKAAIKQILEKHGFLEQYQQLEKKFGHFNPEQPPKGIVKNEKSVVEAAFSQVTLRSEGHAFFYMDVWGRNCDYSFIKQ